MELIQRYLYQVARRLPEKQREDIKNELRGLIEDMLEERQYNGKTEEDNIREVLEELGDPAELAAKYRNGSKHLIGGVYYPVYCQVLKIVLICMGISAGVSVIVNMVMAGINADVPDIVDLFKDSFVELLSTVPMNLITAFGSVTLIFVVLERSQVNVTDMVEKWNVSKLPNIPSEKAVISRGDSIVGLVVCTLLCVVFILYPDFISAWLKDDAGQMVAVPLFNMAIWNRILPLIVVSLTASVVDEAVKLGAGCYNRTVMTTNIITGFVSIVSSVWLLKGLPVFNPDFAIQISSITGKTFSSEFDIMSTWGSNGMAADILLAIIVVGTLVDMALVIYRTLRYELKGNK